MVKSKVVKKKLVVDSRMLRSSGIGTYLRSLLPFLIEKFDVTLLGNSIDIAKCFKSNVNIIDFNFKVYSISEQFGLLITVPKCDIFWSPHYNVPIFLPQAKKRCVTIHDVCHLAYAKKLSVKERVYSNVMLRCAAWRSNYILTDSFFSKKEIEKYLNVRKNISVVYCSVDTKTSTDYLYNRAILDRYSIQKEYILFVGNVKPHKNIISVLKSLEFLKDICLVIVGKKDGFINGDEGIFNFLNENPDISARVIFTGYVEDEDLPSIYKYAKAFVFPSLYEGFGLPPLEAQLHGCPVLASREACIPEVLGDSALYFDPNNPRDIATQLEALLSDLSISHRLHEIAKNNLCRFSWKQSAMEIIDILKDSR